MPADVLNQKATAQRIIVDNPRCALQSAGMKGDLNIILRDLLLADDAVLEMLAAVQSLDLPDCWITAGLIRNRVWDHLHGYTEPTELNDIDVIYFDVDRRNEEAEKHLEGRLHDRLPGYPWSVKNQARMAARNGDRPYRSTSHALEHWCETPTAIAIRLSHRNDIDIIAPLGLGDLFGLIVRPTPYARSNPHKLSQYHERMAKKNWPRQWPKIRVLPC